MATTYSIEKPFPLANRREQAELVFFPYDTAATGDQVYSAGDIVTLTSGKVLREDDATPANIGELCVAAQDWDLSPMGHAIARYQYFEDLGVPCELIDPADEWVMTLDGLFDATANTAVQSGDEREIAFDTTAGVDCLKIGSGTTNTAVKFRRVFKGAVGDTNVQVVVTFLTGVLR